MAKNGALPSWMGVAELSSKTVFVKLAVSVALAHAAEEDDLAEERAGGAVVVQRRGQVGVVGDRRY